MRNFVTGVGKIVHALSEMTDEEKETWLKYLLKTLDYLGYLEKILTLIESRRRHGDWR